MITDQEKSYKHKKFTKTGFNVTPDTVDLITNNEIPIGWVIGSPGLYCRKLTIMRILSQYEVFKRILNVPGSIVECGVFQGAGLLFYAKLLEIFCSGDRDRKAIGFDTFQGFVKISEQDKSASPELNKTAASSPSVNEQLYSGGYSSESFFELLLQLTEIHHKDSFVPGSERVELVKGDVSVTIPKFRQQNKGERISLLILDMDLYEPTLTALQHLYDIVTPGGIIVLDEYGNRRWPGESSAFDDFFGTKKPSLEKFTWSDTPGGFFVKP